MIFEVDQVIDANNFSIDGTALGVYTGQGTIAVISNIQILTKQFTPFWQGGKRYAIKYVDMLFDKTSAGELQVDVYIDFSGTNSMTDVASGSVLGLPIITTYPEGQVPPFPSPAPQIPFYSFQTQQAQIWKRFYTVAQGETFQVQLSYNDAEMRTPTINESAVVLHAMLFYFEEIGEFY
jgi:hypothetical protein